VRALEELEAIGYSIWLDGQRIRLKYRGEGRPDPSRIEPLIEDLRRHKAEVLQILRDRETSRIFKEALAQISSNWIPGLMEHLERHERETRERMWKAEEALERVWARTLKGDSTIEEFREAVKAWRDAHVEAIHLYRDRGEEGFCLSNLLSWQGKRYAGGEQWKT